MKKIIFNGEPLELPANVNNVAELMRWKNIKSARTAIAVNGKIVKSDKFEITPIESLDNILVITAAYGG